ncbi:putative toxin-antitoxin system toxin component, PIN family [Nesterenkonia sp. F]|uniref:PIN domain-containing protein n=1 Tax=Nesterenkonia sp. F TaxID=795955 RepID=UPI000255CA10|nr:PIN domain-containing protein [Nesterenkonia sp. F]
MAFPVLVDACVLVPMATTDLLLRMADARHFRILWSQEILAEVERNLIEQLGLTPEQARRRVSTMHDHFPDALVEDYSNLIPAMTNDEKDRHVLAAAVRANAELIVTFNGKDFPTASVDPYEIDVRSPDDFLLDQLDLHPEGVLQVTHDTVGAMRNPPKTWDEYLDFLHGPGLLPLFATELKRLDADRR